MSVRASAPGKLVLLGEYAVLDGAPALVAAVNRRARVCVEARSGDHCRIDAPEFAEQAADFTIEPSGRIVWQTQAKACRQHYSLFEFVLERLAADAAFDFAAHRPFHISLDTRVFFDGPHKLGLGSSAALTVALAAALAQHAGPAGIADDRRGMLARLLAMHADFQNGAGSGLDVAASLFGGLIAFERPADAMPVRVEPLTWPEDLRMLCLWSGRSASTRRLLKALERARASDVQGYFTHCQAMADIARQGREAMRAGSTGELLASIDAYAGALEAFDRYCGIGIMSAGHEHLRHMAAGAGAVYKPSGAGGGDVGIALSTEPGCLERLRTTAAGEGFKTVELDLDPFGLRWE
ncbi:MAG: mevalonate kinase family protein [Gammaproteobacteria bacterium]